MNEAIIKNWNNLINPEDIVYVLGDVLMGKKIESAKYLARLNGEKYLIIGNHDLKKGKLCEELKPYFKCVYDELWLTINGINLYMHHQPMPKEKWASADYCLIGHVHDRWVRKGNMINVGQDAWGLTPRTLDELLEAKDEGEYNPETDTH